MGGKPALVLDGHVIRDRNEMLCLTDMWKAAGGESSKRPAQWGRNPSTIEFVGHISSIVGLSHNTLFETGSGRGDESGTWAHWQIAMAYAKYLSPEFHAWSNEVVRAHFEGRGLPVAAAQGAITLSPTDLERFAITLGEKAGEGAVRAAREFLSEDVRRQIEPVTQRLGVIERVLLSRRRKVTPTTRSEHYVAVERMGGYCPCGCGLKLVEGGRRIAVCDCDHFEQSCFPGPDATWLICKKTHDDVTYGRVSRTELRPLFDAYQVKRKRLPNTQISLGI